jgi:hypothetical protein
MKRLDQLKLVQYMAYRILEVQKGSKKEVCEKAYKIFTRKKMIGCYARPKRLTSWGTWKKRSALKSKKRSAVVRQIIRQLGKTG